MTLVTMSRSGRLTLPAKVRRQLHLEEQVELEVEVDASDDTIVLRPAFVLRREDAWAYTPGHRETLARAHADSREGRVRHLTEEELVSLGD